LFGVRGTGKSTFLRKQLFESEEEYIYIDLLLPKTEDRYRKAPELLSSDIQAIEEIEGKFVVVGEVQKFPKILDIVHKLIVERSYCFALAGSSARRLKKGGSYLLAGRAFIN
jgi:uncharacterized protein